MPFQAPAQEEQQTPSGTQPTLPGVDPERRTQLGASDRAVGFQIGKEQLKLQQAIEKLDSVFVAARTNPATAELQQKTSASWEKLKTDATAKLAEIEKSISLPTFDPAAVEKSMQEIRNQLVNHEVAAVAFETLALATRVTPTTTPNSPIVPPGAPVALVNANRLLQREAITAIVEALENPAQLEQLLKTTQPDYKLGDRLPIEGAAAYGRSLLDRTKELPYGAQPIYVYDENFYGQQLALTMILDLMKDGSEGESVLKPLLTERFKGFDYDPAKPLGLQLQSWMMRQHPQAAAGETAPATAPLPKLPPRPPAISADPDFR